MSIWIKENTSKNLHWNGKAFRTAAIEDGSLKSGTHNSAHWALHAFSCSSRVLTYGTEMYDSPFTST